MTSQAPPASNSAALWFSRVVWPGILFNLFFIAMEVFAPDFINVGVGLTPGFPTVWNRAHGIMVLALSILYIPAARDPLRYPGYSWTLVVSRLSAAILWAWCLATGQGSFGSYLAMDGAFCVVQAVLLQAALPADQKLPAAIGLCSPRSAPASRRRTSRPPCVWLPPWWSHFWRSAGWEVYDNLLRHGPELVYSDIVQHYKYATIGLGPCSRIPYWMFKVLPDVFADKLPGPGGLASLGLIQEDGIDRPVGFAKRVFGYECVEANCSLCHTAVYRTAPGAKPVVVPGGPAHTLDLQGFQRFLYSAAEDPLRTPSRASESSRSNSLHCIPLLVWSGITSPAYRYVEGALQVPLDPYLFSISRCPPEPSKRWQFLCNPYLVSPLESLLPEVRAKVWPRPGERFQKPPGCAPGHPAGPIGPVFAH